ncbi:DNA polymerase III subunit delta' [Polynucleobacter sp. IMCC 29146]|uniref:DNA polymerase III subunit delta' n=1 Tax=Polynucleobacter sp. IMCC 29146 TaxID=2780953 RepID=UPI001F23B138|nr:DNA polymerase III subunit delta' [Polynucleobacter sp. IMCC 29146]MCE7528744.1 DNA polymerase III subunit delta' [Polynucleobacter sp. IMCC 29146]
MSLNQPIAPWLQGLWGELPFAAFPHAVLIYGQAGIGKYDFAIHLAQALLCECAEPNISKPCQQCEACRWFATGNHPDFMALVPEIQHKYLPQAALEGGQADAPVRTTKARDDEADAEATDKKEKRFIAIAEARSVISSLGLGSHRGGNRVILVSPLEQLKPDAANTLLKSLEEPPPQTIFILVAARLDRVLPTIRSRCRLLQAPKPERAIGLSWLQNKLATEKLNAISTAEIEALYDEFGDAPFAVYETLLARSSEDEKDELLLGALATKSLLQGLANGIQIDWLSIAEKIHKAPVPILLITLQRWCADLQGLSQANVVRYYPKHTEVLRVLAKQVRLVKLMRWWKMLLQARRHENHPLATRIQMEALLLQYQNIFSD